MVKNQYAEDLTGNINAFGGNADVGKTSCAGGKLIRNAWMDFEI